MSIIRSNDVMSNTTIHEEFINDKARQQLFRPYQPSSGLEYKNTEDLSVNYLRYQAGSRECKLSEDFVTP
jgi:hypothetical protein